MNEENLYRVVDYLSLGYKLFDLFDMYTDINNKAKAMDAQLNAVIGDINRFMSDLETVYSKSPSQYPIPDNSVLTAKLEQPVQDTLTYTNSTRGVIISNTKPANPVSKEIIWFNTGTPVR